MSEILRVENIEKYYGNRFSLTKAVDRMSLRVEKGEFVAIMGASGSGKTTLLNCIATIDRVSSGRIYVDGRDITRLRGNALVRFRRDSIGFVFQEFNLLDTMTAYENIALALQIQKVKEKEIRARIAHVANLLGIESIMDKYPYQLSGGQKQRVACARAVVTRPSLILADEPTGALDSRNSRMLLECLGEMNSALSSTILMVTHDAFSDSYASRVIFIKDGSVFHEIFRGDDVRRAFFSRIIDVVTLLGGDVSDVLSAVAAQSLSQHPGLCGLFHHADPGRHGVLPVQCAGFAVRAGHGGVLLL